MNKLLSPIHYGEAKYRPIKISKIRTGITDVQAGVARSRSRINLDIMKAMRGKLTTSPVNAKDIIKKPLTDNECDHLGKAYEHLNIMLQRPGFELYAEDLLNFNDICLFGFSLGSMPKNMEVNTFMENHGMLQQYQKYQKNFYKHIRPTWEWLSKQAQNPDISAYTLAAGAYTRIVNDSKLFTDGHQRTGAIVMAYFFDRAGIETFHLNAITAPEFFTISNKIKNCNNWIMLNSYRNKLSVFLSKHFHHRYMRIPV